jgi:hypothetical protein
VRRPRELARHGINRMQLRAAVEAGLLHQTEAKPNTSGLDS